MTTKEPTKDPLAGPTPFASPFTRPRNGSQTGLDGNPDPMNLGAAGTVDPRPTGVPAPQEPGNPFGGRPAT